VTHVVECIADTARIAQGCRHRHRQQRLMQCNVDSTKQRALKSGGILGASLRNADNFSASRTF
jgi:hypothetical protein